MNRIDALESNDWSPVTGARLVDTVHPTAMPGVVGKPSGIHKES